MSKKSKSKHDVHKKFDPETWQRAGEISSEYKVVIHLEDGYWYGNGVEFEYALGGGTTAAKCVVDTQEAMQCIVGMMLEKGESPPLPCNQNRTEQLNIRISPVEKMRLESATAQGGFRSISDYVRFAAVSGATNKK